MHDLKEHTNTELESRFRRLQEGPIRYATWFDFQCTFPEDCPWNSLDAIEAELVRRETLVTR